MPGREVVVDHRRQREAGAGSLGSLIEDLRHGVAVHDLIRQRYEPRVVEPIADVDPVRERIHRPPQLLGDGTRALREATAISVRTRCLRPGWIDAGLDLLA
jgi:hypothetical protein